MGLSVFVRVAFVLSALVAVGCAGTAAEEAACEPIDATVQLLELTGAGTCKVPPYATLSQFNCTGERTLEVETSADQCAVSVRFKCSKGPAWSLSLYQETDETLRGKVEVHGADCDWHGEAFATIKR